MPKNNPLPSYEKSGMTEAAYELALFIENDSDLYRQQTLPIITNLQKKFTKGTYDHAQAVKLWKYLADNGAKKYTWEFDNRHGKGHWQKVPGFGVFTPEDRRQAAAWLADKYLEHVQQGYAFKTKVRTKNPAPYKNPARPVTSWTRIGNVYRSGNFIIYPPNPDRVMAQDKYLLRYSRENDRDITLGAYPTLTLAKEHAIEPDRLTNPAPFIGTARPHRRSQITKKAPTKRLVARRKKNTQRGRFPNPSLASELHAHRIKDSIHGTAIDKIELLARLFKGKSTPLEQQAHVSYVQGYVDCGYQTKSLTANERKELLARVQQIIRS